MPREFAAALVMTAIIAFFTFQLDDSLDEQSLIVPRFLLYLMGGLNILQYILAIIRNWQRIDTLLTVEGYPLKKVTILCALTVAYICVLDYAGFYLSSFIYMITVSLIAQPMPTSGSGIMKRALLAFLFVGFLYLLFTVALTVQIPKGFMPF